MAITYRQMVDYLNHRNFQNTATEALTSFDVVIAINTGLYELSANLTHPLLSLETSVLLEEEGKTFSFNSDIKKVNNIYGRKDGDTEWIKLNRVYTTLKTYSEAWHYQCRVYGNTVKTGDNFIEVKIDWEFMLPYIENTAEALSQTFQLWDFLASAVCEYAMSLLVPANLVEWYNLQQYHMQMFNKMITTASKQLSNIAGNKTLKNDLR